MRKSASIYLKTIFEASYVKKSTNNKQLAQLLKIAPGSITGEIAYMEKAGLVKRKRYVSIWLSREGMEKANYIIYKYRLCEIWLDHILHTPLPIIPEQAWLMSAMNNEDIIKKLNVYLGMPKFSPFGGPLRPEYQKEKLQVLTEVKKDQWVVIRQYLDKKNIIKYMQYIDFKIGKKVKLVDKKDDLEIIVMQDLNNHQYLVNGNIAQFIYVAAVN